MIVMTADARNYCVAVFPARQNPHRRHHRGDAPSELLPPGFSRLPPLPARSARGTLQEFTPAASPSIGRGVLLCGDSGAGKTSLSWACARAGWDFIADDTSYLLHGEENRASSSATRHQVRFRPSAAELFPEIAGAEMTPRVFGQPSIELPTAPMEHITTRDCAHVDFIVFLNRRTPSPPELVPYGKDVARCYMRQWLFGTPEIKVRSSRGHRASADRPGA